MPNEASLVFLTVISARKQGRALIEAISQAGGRLIGTVYGRGSAHEEYLLDMFGFVPEQDKLVINCILSKAKTDAMMGMLSEKFHFDRPNTGIAFAIRIEDVSF